MRGRLPHSCRGQSKEVGIIKSVNADMPAVGKINAARGKELPRRDLIQLALSAVLPVSVNEIKDASDTNTDFDDIDSAIRGGYFLKEGLANNEDFYFLNLLITVAAPSEEDLEWKVNEMKKLLASQDMQLRTCHFREEQAFLKGTYPGRSRPRR